MQNSPSGAHQSCIWKNNVMLPLIHGFGVCKQHANAFKHVFNLLGLLYILHVSMYILRYAYNQDLHVQHLSI